MAFFSVVQVAAETALNLPDSYLKQVQTRYCERRNLMIQGLGELGWQIPKTKATMYLWVPCPPGRDSTDFALDLLQQTGIVVTPGSAFGRGGEGYLRVSLIADCDRLMEALNRLKQAGICFSTANPSDRPLVTQPINTGPRE